jgi:hypothetical protein
MRIGELLIGKGLVTSAQLEAALERQRHLGGRLGNHLIALGALTVEQLLTTLRGQQEGEARLKLCTHALQRSERTYGTGHPTTDRARYNLARAFFAAGHATDSLPYAEAALAGHGATLGRDHAWTREAAQLLADVRDAASRAGRDAGERERAAAPPGPRLIADPEIQDR